MPKVKAVESEKWNSVYSSDELRTCASLSEIIFKNMQFVANAKGFEKSASVKKVESFAGQTCSAKTSVVPGGRPSKSVSTFPTNQFKQLDPYVNNSGYKFIPNIPASTKSFNAVASTVNAVDANNKRLKHVEMSFRGHDFKGSDANNNLNYEKIINKNERSKLDSKENLHSSEPTGQTFMKIEEALEEFLKTIRGAQKESEKQVSESTSNPVNGYSKNSTRSADTQLALKLWLSAWKKKNKATCPTKFNAQNVEREDPNKQMKQLTRDWIVSALNTPNSMRQIVTQFRHIVEGFWPFNNPSLMNVPHPDIMHVIAEEMQTILIKCEEKTVGYPSVAAQPRTMPHFCNYLNLLGHFISEFVNLPYQVPDFLMDIAFRSCVLCLQPPLQWQMAQALVRLWRMVGCEMEARVQDFADLVDGIRDAVLLGERAPAAGDDDDGPDPKALLIEALELRARRWRPASKSGESGDGGAGAACGGGGVTALTEALARATLTVDNFGAAGDCGRNAAAAGHMDVAL